MSTVRGEGRSFALLTKDATSYSIAVCHGNVKPFSRAKDEKKKGVPRQRNLYGQMSDKSQMVSNFKTGRTKLTSNGVSDMKVRVYGNTAVITGKADVAGTMAGKDAKGQIMFARVYVKKGGSWQFVCMVMRGWTAPTYTPTQFRDLVYDPKVHAPICFNPAASRTVMPYYELRSKLAMVGKAPEQIAEGIQAAYAKGVLPKRDEVSFAYMWSADQHLAPGIGHWHPHMMVFSPYYENSMLGGNEFGPPIPIVTDDGGTPFAVVVIPVDDKLAIKAQAK